MRIFRDLPVLALLLASATTFMFGQATNTFPASGNVGIGSTNPSQLLSLSGGFLSASTNNGQYSLAQLDAASSPIATAIALGGVFGGDVMLRSYWGVSVDINAGNSGDGGQYAPNTRIPGITAFTINSRNSASTFQTLFTVRNNGYVGIGTTAPGSALEVNGNIALTSGSGTSLTYPDGTKQTTAWTGVVCGGDYAEDVEATGSKIGYQPGDVLVISTNSDKDVQISREPYSTNAAGIYATKPGVVGKRESLAKATDDIPMAMVGIVPTKVSAENGPIHRGDLLVTSSRAGYAMKGTDRARMFGAVIGKAMGILENGTGTIEVLVTLQ